ncbi:hypothetical protein [Pseudothauera rhizosphaerae]|uniref:Uncharacterized protein n=1 Tax=Pseudothauera rhizosphaerae TaxID=2565932 RepID=A0A4S4AMU8_9RHOO|nr:hypothetical protein [Pseudothauera rhizosphaerae]THF60905.1 hypothetical protein E6O51_11790 [Pseudothauera rhizosphaerae]
MRKRFEIAAGEALLLQVPENFDWSLMVTTGIGMECRAAGTAAAPALLFSDPLQGQWHELYSGYYSDVSAVVEPEFVVAVVAVCVTDEGGTERQAAVVDAVGAGAFAEVVRISDLQTLVQIFELPV